MTSEITRMSGSHLTSGASGSGSTSGNGGEKNNYPIGSISEDPNSGTDVKPVSIFSNDYKKHDDLKQMLDSNKDNLKLDAMKRIVGMIAKGKNASDLFPAVVKNVVSKNVEIKKLVYVYLMRYAEEQQDLALLSISTFQRALKDPNQLIRASALRVLSSIRVPIIVTIMMLAIKEAVSDMSPYVRKTAANAITKLYSLDPELKEDLVSIIEKLLADKTILVAGSAIQAFEEVCPERIDLIHKNYRKLCNLLIDVDEWGQVVIINMLTRYARNQFLNPYTASSSNEPKLNESKDEKDENDDGEDDDDDDDDYDSKFVQGGSKLVNIDPDHRLLLRVTKPLLQSRNSAVVMAVAQLYYYVAPKNEAQIMAKALVRLLRSHREVQIIVLKNIVSIAQKNQQMFQPHQKSFYVHSNDSIQIKLLKLEILTCLANESNISVILREFQAYVLSNDKEFAAATINAIGRCASTIKEVADNCLTGLVNLMSKKDETIVGESVVVIKRLLQSNPSKNGSIIKKMSKMIDKLTVPMARASILWLIGEYSDRVSKQAPDVLRKMAKTFCEEENVVKLQILNLAAKLYVTNQKQVTLLVQYVLNLAKYDQNYDIRDRSRFLRALIFNNDNCPVLAKHLKKILLVSKPAPVLQSIYKDSDQYQLGTLSHAISSRVNGYTELPDFPLEAPDPTVRNIEIPVEMTKSAERRNMPMGAGGTSKSGKSSSKRTEKFYSDEEDEDEKSQSTEGADPTNDEDEDEDEDEENKSDDETDKEEEDESGSESGSESESEKSDASDSKKSKKKKNGRASNSDNSEDSSSDSEEDQDSNESEEESDKEKAAKKSVSVKPKVNATIKDSKTVLTTSSESESSSSQSESESESEPDQKAKPTSKTAPFSSKPAPHQIKPVTKIESQPKEAAVSKKNSASTKKETKKEISLLDLDFSEPSSSSGVAIPSIPNTLEIKPSSILSPSLAADLAHLSSSTSMNFNQQITTSKKEYELINKIFGNGLQIKYRFTRMPHPNSNKMISIELTCTNVSNGDFVSVSITNKKLQMGMSMSDLNEFDLIKGASLSKTIGIDFNDTLQSAQFEITAVYSNDPLLGGTSTTKKWPNLSITCPIGELVQPGWSISENEFNKLQAKLKGMNEINGTIDELVHAQFISKNLNTKLLENVNMCQIPSSQQDTIKFAALTFATKTPLLLSLYFASNSKKCQINVNCEKIVLANMFLKEIKQLLSLI